MAMTGMPSHMRSAPMPAHLRPPPPRRSSHTTLYRLYDAAGELLYIGIAGNPGRRFEQHADRKAWWGAVSRCDLEHYETRSAALEAEATAIETERPALNVVHNCPGVPDEVEQGSS